jgi:hypothetical protein
VDVGLDEEGVIRLSCLIRSKEIAYANGFFGMAGYNGPHRGLVEQVKKGGGHV